MEKYIYFRATSGVAGDQDETSGSVMYPLSHFKGMVAGDATDATGAITDDDDRFTMFFEPIRVGGGAGGSATAASDRVDNFVFDVTAGDFDFRNLFEEFSGYVNAPGAHSNGMVTIYDGVTGKGLSGVTGIHSQSIVQID
tara:strand:- start:358 stop:777 length:420 start_codon:yes stop_codon:yes gene_type:complete